MRFTNPDVKTEPVEFIELLNAGSAAVDLSGWSISEAVSFTFPPGTSLAPGANAVIAQNPNALRAEFNASALGPWQGSLAGRGERIVLRNAIGAIEDEVNYQLGFPWPTVGDPPGYSIELVHPDLDNDLGGSWRASVQGNPMTQSLTLIPERSTWTYFKGLSEPSSPVTAWRLLGFSESGWLTGGAPIGYGENFLVTRLDDMRGGYVGFLPQDFRGGGSFAVFRFGFGGAV